MTQRLSLKEGNKNEAFWWIFVAAWLTHIILAGGFPGSSGQFRPSAHQAADYRPHLFLRNDDWMFNDNSGRSNDREAKTRRKNICKPCWLIEKTVDGWSKKLLFSSSNRRIECVRLRNARRCFGCRKVTFAAGGPLNNTSCRMLISDLDFALKRMKLLPTQNSNNFKLKYKH